MVKVEIASEIDFTYKVPSEYKNGKRHLTDKEIKVLKENQNHNLDESWKNILVDDSPDGFDPSLIKNCFFSGYIVIGKLRLVFLKWNDLRLAAGIRNSKLKNIVIGDDCVVYNVDYFENYRIGNRVILFDIKEICCTNHSKFGNGILKQGESEDARMWIGVANENDGRRILPFESMIAADAYLWSHYRDDKELLQRFVELTESGNTGALDTKTSKQIMDLIKEISKDKLVIMVTHNPDLAHTYSNRIIEFMDGEVVGDTNPYNEEEKIETLKIKKTKMSYMSAINLSFKNLKTKFGRTFITAFASSIGIIGIALILSLSNGFKIKIDEFEKNALSQAPVLIQEQTVDTSSMGKVKEDG